MTRLIDIPPRQLAAFVAVAQERSFTAAAYRLHTTQPGVSRQVSALEERLGVQLVRRLRPVRLTTAGAAVLPAAQEVMLALARLNDTAKGQRPTRPTEPAVGQGEDRPRTQYRASRSTSSRRCPELVR